jgi:hypothetical protein
MKYQIGFTNRFHSNGYPVGGPGRGYCEAPSRAPSTKAVGEARPDEREIDIPGAERTAVTDFGARQSPTDDLDRVAKLAASLRGAIPETRKGIVENIVRLSRSVEEKAARLASFAIADQRDRHRVVDAGDGRPPAEPQEQAAPLTDNFLGSISPCSPSLVLPHRQRGAGIGHGYPSGGRTSGASARCP